MSNLSQRNYTAHPTRSSLILAIDREASQLLQANHPQGLLVRGPQIHLGHDALTCRVTLLLRVQQGLLPTSGAETPFTACRQPYGTEVIATRGAKV